MAALAAVWDLIAKDGATPTFNKVAVSADRAAVATERATASGVGFGKKVAAALGAVAAVDIGVHMISEAAKFQRAMLLIQTQAGASATEVKSMTKAVLGLAGSVGTAPEKLATSLYHIESVGLRGAKALNVLKIAAEGAKIGNGDLEQTTNALTSAVASGIPGVKNMQQAMGALNAIVGSGDMKLSDLNEALSGGILTVVKGYGLSLRDVGAALATFGDNNIRGAEAATMLRMAVQAMAVPAKAGKDELKALGLTTKTLSQDMQTGGLNKAILDLKAHLDAAGVSSVQVGAVLTEVFGKRAGPGLAVLIGQVDRLESKYGALDSGAKRFGMDWEATKHTASFALQQIGAQFEAAGITLGTKLLPAVTAAAQWLGTNVPKAVSTLQRILHPLVEEFAAVFVPALKLAAAILKTVGSALAGLGGFLSHNTTLVAALATAVLSMWAAYKGYQIARIAIVGVVGLVNRLGAVTEVAGLRMKAAAAGAGPALAGIGTVVGLAVYAWQKHQAAVAAWHAEAKQDTEDIANTLTKVTGAITKSTTAWIQNQLVTAGAYTALEKLGVSYDTVTAAAEGNKGALDKVNAAVKGQSILTDGQINKNVVAAGKIRELAGATKNAQGNVKQLGKVQHETAGTTTNLGTAVRKVSGAFGGALVKINGVTYGLKGEKTASDLLSNSLDVLSGKGNSVAEAQLALLDGLGQATQQVKDNGAALKSNTAAGRSNLEWLHQQIDSINAVAKSQIDNGAQIKTVTDKLGANEKALYRAATAAGFNKDQVAALIKKYAATPTKVETYLIAHTAGALNAIAVLRTELNNLPRQVGISVTATGNIAVAGRGRYATGGSVYGPGTSTSDSIVARLSNGEFVVNAAQASKHRSLLNAINNGMDGFASGGTVGKKNGVYTVDGSTTQYSSRLGAMNSARRILKAELDLGVKINSKDLTNLNKVIHGTVDQAKAWFTKLSDHLKGLPGFSSYLVTSGSARGGNLKQVPLSQWLRDEDKKLNTEIGKANATAAKLKDVRDKMSQLASGVKSAVTGFFDVTQAGASPVTGRVSGGGLLAQQKQALLKVKKFASDLHRLESRHLNKAYLMELASQGPSALPQMDALLSLSNGQFSTFNRDEAAIARYGASAGRGVAQTVYGAQERSLAKVEHAQRKAAADIIHEIRHELVPAVKHLEKQPVNVYLDGKKIAEATRKSNNQTARR